MARYKVGDKVRMIDKFVQDGIYYMRGLSNRPGPSVTIKWSLQDRMRLAGKIVTISEAGEYYRIEEDGRRKIGLMICLLAWQNVLFVGHYCDL